MDSLFTPAVRGYRIQNDMDTRETQYQARSTKRSTIASSGGRRGAERKLPVMVGHYSPIEAGLLVCLSCALIERNGGGRLEEIETILDGRLPGAWALMLTRQKQGGGCLPLSGCLPGTLR